MGQKRCYFEKRTGEVIDSKEKWPKTNRTRTGKRSGEVIENAHLWKKRTENEPKTNSETKLPILLKLKGSENRIQRPPRDSCRPGACPCRATCLPASRPESIPCWSRPTSSGALTAP